ncbi:hypothetical protein WPS_35200 [Vulcanimicrobium alpinum]|uniref:Uncharacterized protein n=1 Tax=Vulcanimicrobium alpinum TaxID=3016050 RepID=A0AAN1Y082_UNVUL|nr:hypothetical protein WPS_35200 [Vulcanimicrobium alpinum]
MQTEPAFIAASATAREQRGQRRDKAEYEHEKSREPIKPQRNMIAE